MSKLLQGTDLVKKFGGMTAVDNVTFHINEGEILGLIGPNGAGKTTLFNLVSGALSIDSGTIVLDDKKISGLQSYHICHLGLARTFQAAKNFKGMSVRENVMMGALFGAGKESRDEAEADVDRILDFVGLSEYTNRTVSDIPIAGQKQLEVARALATRPRLLMLDEVMAGLNPTEVENVMALVRKIRESGITVLLIEHVMKAIMAVCDRIIVLHHGQLIAEGTPDEIANNEEVIEIYLGGEV